MDDPGSCCGLLATTIHLDGLFWLGLAFVALTTFVSAAALALRYVSWVKLEEAFEKKGRPERAGVIRGHLVRWVAATAVFRLIATIGVLLCVVHAFTTRADVDAPAAVVLLEAFLLGGLILLIFSVAVPHAWGKYAGTSLLVHAFPVLRGMEVLSRPFSLLFHLIDVLVRRLAGINAENGNGRLDERQEELLSVFEEGQKEGIVDEEEKEMITSVLEFRETTVEEIMTPRTDVIGIEAGLELAEAVKIVLEAGHSRFPVYEGSMDHVIGMLYAKDLLHILVDEAPDRAIRSHLREPFFVPESKTLRDLLHDFQNQKVHMAVVLDEYGGTAGLVTIEDILEELVGEIVDEYETPPAEPLLWVDDHTLEVDARMHVHEFNDETDLEIPEEDDYETLGGFAFAKLGSIPKRGETFTHGNLQFTVLDADPRRINRVRVVILREETPSQADKP